MIELENGLQNREAGARGTLSVILVSLGPPEVGHNAVAEVLGHVATVTGDRFGRGMMIAGDELTPFLGVQAGCDLGRAD